MNQIFLVGNLGKFANVTKTQNSIVANFSVATSRRIKSGPPPEYITDWHRIVAWGDRLVNQLNAAKPGDRIHVTGAVTYRKYQTEAGEKMATEILAQEIVISPKPQQENNDFAGDTEEVPF